MSSTPVYKILLAGDANVGKTSLIQRFCTGTFSPARRPTIGTDSQTANVQLGPHTLTLSIWDIAEAGRFQAHRDQFSQGTLAVALIYDVTVPATFFNLPRWRDQVRTNMPDVPLAVVGNKLDLTPVISPADAANWARFEGHLPFLQTSALTGENVDDFFAGMAYLAYQYARHRAQP